MSKRKRQVSKRVTRMRKSQRRPLNRTRAVHSVSFLLTYLSEMGNEPVNGNVTNGLALALRKIDSFEG
jgi:hypothetical protein